MKQYSTEEPEDDYESDVFLCEVCGLPVGEDAHWGHEPECARYQDSNAECNMECELYYHPACCPECNA